MDELTPQRAATGSKTRGPELKRALCCGSVLLDFDNGLFGGGLPASPT